MGIPSELGAAWANKKRSFVVASPNEDSENSVREAVQAAFKTAIITGAVVAVPTLIGCRVIPWAKANLNHTAQALIISSGFLDLSHSSKNKAPSSMPTSLLPLLASLSQLTELFYRMPGKILWGSLIKQLDEDPPCSRKASIL